MIDADLRRAVAALAAREMSAREISWRLKISRNTVATIIAQGGAPPKAARADKVRLDPDLLARLYGECDGYARRVHEKLLEEHKIEVGYPTLTHRLRELGISSGPSRRVSRVPDTPGTEMQHDTSFYRVELGGVRTPVVASLLYLRYSKRRYLKFFRRFDRFRMKCFFHEALVYWGYAAAVCIIDNTNLARLSGAGPTATIAPEMEAFARARGFRFQCHAIGHPNRKAGEERSFLTVETSFLPGRTFVDLADLNRQAFEWATVRMERRKQTADRIVPAEAFDREKAHLSAVPPELPAPYRSHDRGIDQYGYVAFEANHYWVPGEGRGQVTVLEYADSLEIYRGRERLAVYPLPAEGVREQRVSPDGVPAPLRGPRHDPRPTAEEEARLRAIAPVVGAWLDRVLAGGGRERHSFLRRLYALSRRMSDCLFARSVERAHRYGVADLETLERIAHLQMTVGDESVTPVEFDESYRDREAYREGELADRPDLAKYQERTGEDDGRADDDDAEEAAPVGAH